MAQHEGSAPKKFTIPSIEEIRQYGVSQENNGPVLFNKSTTREGGKQNKHDESVVQQQAVITSEATIAGSVAVTLSTKSVQQQAVISSEAMIASSVAVTSSTTSPLMYNTRVATTTGSSYSIVANPVQRNNPVVHFIRNIPVMFDDIIPDFVLGRTTCALFLRYQEQLYKGCRV